MEFTVVIPARYGSQRLPRKALLDIAGKTMIQRVYEQCERNISETARRLRMHRRTLQRILAKHAPRD